MAVMGGRLAGFKQDAIARIAFCGGSGKGLFHLTISTILSVLLQLKWDTMMRCLQS